MPTLTPEFQPRSAPSKREEVKALLRREALVVGRGNKLATVLALCAMRGRVTGGSVSVDAIELS